jgi:hypothetical protein
MFRGPVVPQHRGTGGGPGGVHPRGCGGVPRSGMMPQDRGPRRILGTPEGTRLCLRPGPAALPPSPPPIDGARAPCRQLQPNCHRTSGATWLPLIARHNPCTLIAPVSGRHSRRIRSKLRQSQNPPGPCRDIPNRVSPALPESWDEAPPGAQIPGHRRRSVAGSSHRAAPSTMSVRYSRPDPARLPGARLWTAEEGTAHESRGARR